MSADESWYPPGLGGLLTLRVREEARVSQHKGRSAQEEEEEDGRAHPLITGGTTA